MSEPGPGSELLQGAFESFPDAVVVTDDRSRIVLANAGCRALLGHDPRRLVGQPVSLLVPSLAAAGPRGPERAGWQRPRCAPTARGSGRR